MTQWHRDYYVTIISMPLPKIGQSDNEAATAILHWDYNNTMTNVRLNFVSGFWLIISYVKYWLFLVSVIILVFIFISFSWNHFYFYFVFVFWKLIVLVSIKRKGIIFVFSFVFVTKIGLVTRYVSYAVRINVQGALAFSLPCLEIPYQTSPNLQHATYSCWIE